MQQIINRIPLLKIRYLGSFPSDNVPTLDNDTIINKQPSNMQGEHWIMIAIFRHDFCFADSLERKGCSFLNNNNQQTSIWCQHPYSLTQEYAAFIQYMQLFIYQSFDKIKLQGLTMFTYLLLYVIRCNFSIFVCKCAVSIMFLSVFIHSN